jgi:hypothetical protein
MPTISKKREENGNKTRHTRKKGGTVPTNQPAFLETYAMALDKVVAIHAKRES